jgi:hypothetical protein
MTNDEVEMTNQDRVTKGLIAELGLSLAISAFPPFTRHSTFELRHSS